MNTVISFIGLVVVFALAYGLDRWAEVLQRQARANFAWTSFYWFLSISTLIIAGSVLVLAWFVCFRTDKRWLISVVFLVIGFFATFAFAIGHSITSTSFPYMVVPFFLAPIYRVAYVSAFVTAIGVAGLLLSKND